MWWDPYYDGYDYYMKLEPEMETQETRYRPEQMEFWNSLPLFENVDTNVIRDELWSRLILKKEILQKINSYFGLMLCNWHNYSIYKLKSK